MFPDFGYGETIQHIRFTGVTKDADGYRTSGYAEPVTVENVGVDVATVSEPRESTTELSRVDITLYLPAGYETSSRDRFIVRGKTYQAEGAGVMLQNFLTGDIYRTEQPVRRVDGQEKG